MQAVLALAFLALANAAIIDPIYYKPEYMKYDTMDYSDKYMSDAALSSVADAVIASAAPGVAPISFAKSAMPWASIISGAAPAVSSAIPLEAAYGPAMKSGLASAIPAVKSAAYHLVKADYPYFTAAPTSSYVEAASPIAAIAAEEMAARGLFPALSSAFPATAASLLGAFPATAATAASLAAAEPALRAAGLVHAASPATHFVVAPSAAAAGAPLFKSAAFPWGLVATPASAVSAASTPIALMKAASPLLGAESAFAPAVHAIHASPAFAAASPSGFAPILVKAVPASFATGLSGAESALNGFAPAGAASAVPLMVKAISPASGLFGAETAIAFAPAHAGHAHAISPAMKAAFPFTAASLAGDALTFARGVPTLSGADAALSAYAVPSAGYAYLAESPALKAWIK